MQDHSSRAPGAGPIESPYRALGEEAAD
eukprot:COSAG01_NODE_67458_length_267_cov_0.601190_1_plen_27_part_01